MSMEKIYSRIDTELAKRLGHVIVDKGLNQPAAIAEAIEQWVEAAEQGIADPKASKGENTGQALSSHNSASTEEVVLDPLDRHHPNPQDVINVSLSRAESEWVLGLLEVIRCDAPGVAQWIQGNIKVFRDWVRSNERAADSVSPPGTSPGLQGGAGGVEPGGTEAVGTAQSALDHLNRAKESLAAAQDRGAKPHKKADRSGGKTGTGGSSD